MRFRFFPTCAFVLLASNIVSAQTAGMVSFQGLIRSTATGNPPITTPVSLEFRIFNADTGGTMVDMDGDGTVENTAAAPGAGTDAILVGPLTPNGGIVSTKFGPVSPRAFTGCTPGVPGCRWLEVTVVGSPTPLSRLEMVTPPGAAEQINKPSGPPLISQAANGNVGIGTTSPGATLHVKLGDGSGPVSLFVDRGDVIGGFEWLRFLANSASHWRIRSQVGSYELTLRNTSDSSIATFLQNGNVGFGTESPTHRLSVEGRGYTVADTSGAFEGFRVSANDYPSSGGYLLLGRGTGSSGPGTIQSGDNVDFDALALNPLGGNVGIGTNSPSARFHVASNAGSQGGVKFSHIDAGPTALGSNTISGISFRSNGADPSSTTHAELKFSGSHSQSAYALQSSLSTNDAGSPANLLLQPLFGNVGIGTNDPTARLAVQQAVDTNAGGIRVTNTSVNRSLHAWVDSSSRGRIDVGVNADSPICLNAAGVGNVGIGTTDPSSKLSIRRDDDGRLLSFERTGMESWWVGPITTGSRGLAFANATDTDAVRLMLAEPGTVGIGTTSPVAKLDVFDPGSPGRHGLSVLANCDAGFATMRVHSDHNPDGSRILLSVTQQANPRLVVRMDGKVGIGTSSPSATLHVNGDIITTNGTCCGSDARFKKNISTVTTAMAKLLSLRGVWFQWKEPKEHGDEARRQMGMIAQEVEKVLPEWVIKDKEGYRYLNTTGFPALAVEAIREMKQENDTLKNRVDLLERDLADIKAMLRH